MYTLAGDAKDAEAVAKVGGGRGGGVVLEKHECSCFCITDIRVHSINFAEENVMDETAMLLSCASSDGNVDSV